MLQTTFTRNGRLASVLGRGRLALVLCLSGLLSFALTVRADEDGYDGQDPPGRVARMSALDGSVSLQPGGEGDWGAAARNRPVTVGDKIWVDKDSRAELQSGAASIHLGAMSALSFLNLDVNITQIRLAEGSLHLRVREIREGDQYEVDMPNVAFVVREAGAFHIDVNETGDGTRITVLRGEGEVTSGGSTYDIHQGERAEFNGTDGNVEYRPERVRGDSYDDLDRWATERDLREERSVSGRYVSHDMVGYSDLDDYGDWNEEPEYGHVWYPRNVEVGWAPYSYGYWNWVGPWGWTWVDYSPWGFAPFHYGRWNYFGGRWGWCPGPVIGYPVYGPAFVGFLGGGFGGGLGIGVGVGWFPLGYGEVYHPWYRCGGGYLRNINIHNTYIRNVNIINNNVSSHNYAYAHNPAAVTATSHAAFANGQLVNRRNARLTTADLRGAQVTNRVNVTPTKMSYTGAANARGRVATPPASVQNRGVVARTAPAAGAANAPVRTINPGGRANGNAQITARDRQLSTNRPPSAQNNTRANGSFNAQPNGTNRPNSTYSNRPNANYSNGANTNSSRPNSTNSNRPNANYSNGTGTNSNRPNATYSNRPANNPAPTMSSRSDRPNWAGSGANSSANTQGASRSGNNRPPTTYNGRSYNESGSSSQRPYSSSPRQYSAPQQRPYSAPHQRTYSQPPQRSYSAPQQQRQYSAPQQRAYSAPQRSYSPPSRGNSAPSAPNRSAPAPNRSSGGNNQGPHGHGH
jgi:hypothetical protein